jgi:Mg-chelatase subunit ChlD
MHLSFIFPAALWLLVLLVPLWALALATPRRLSSPRFWSSLLLRTALVLALVLALAGAQAVRSVDRLTTVFLIDSSDSISPSARGQAEAFVQDALRAMRPGDQAAVVVFGENALVERAPGSEATLGRLSSVPVAARTDIQSALQLGLALLPADTEQRLVLLSDGGENAGHALDAANVAASRGVPISYVDIGSPESGGAEALLSALDAPTNVRQGEKFDLVATVESNVAQTVRLRIFADDRALDERDVQLQPGSNQFRLNLDAAGQGFQHYRATIEPRLDVRAQNNAAATLVRVVGAPRVLLVEGTPGDGRNLADALAAAQVNADLVAPDMLPSDLAGLGDYEAVVLINVPARALPVKAVANLPVYVRELGRGLVMVGGDRSFGVGGYGRTPIEEAMPVYMDVRDRQERPDLALVFVVDKSGSMDACHCSGPNRQTAQFREGGVRKVDIAKDAVLQASAVLREHDTVGVVAFDGSAHWVVPAQRDPSEDALRSALAPIAPEGGTNVQAGLQAAEEALLHIDARIKHVILLTDGWSGGGNNLDAAQRMREAGITLSVVAAGGGSADYLRKLAEAGGGRYYPAQNMEDVPQIFVQETITAVGNYLVEEQFTPSYVFPSPILDQLDGGLPLLYGYNGTTIKETASTILAGSDGAPVLALWQYGLGRAVAWTSDVKGKWAKAWIGWSGFPRFAAQLVGWVLPSGASDGVSASLRNEGARTIVEVKAQDEGGKSRDSLVMRANIVGANGFAEDIALTQVAPGEYRGSLTSPLQGTYIVQVAGAQDGRVVVQSTAGMVVPYSSEYRQGQRNPGLLDGLAHASGGARLQQPADAFTHNLATVTSAQEIALPLLLLALLLLPIDVGARRLMLRQEDFRGLAARLRGGQATVELSAETQLKRARARFARRGVAGDSRGQPSANAGPDPGDVAAPDKRIERLRAAKERARRKARGEE